MRSSISMKLLKCLFYLLLAILLIYTLFPFYWAIVSSFRSGSELFTTDILPQSFSFANYIAVFVEQPFGQNILNSVIVASSTVIMAMLLGISAAYALGRYQFSGWRFMLLTILGISMFPQVAVLSGLFELVQSLGMYNTLWGLSLTYLLMTLPFTVWVLTSFMKQFPRELEEAAIMDGASSIKILTRIFLPLLTPAMVTTGLLSFIVAWNEFLFALTFTMTNAQRTVPVAIALLNGASEHELPWGNIMAASVIVTVPLIVLVLIFQRRIVSGLTAGAVKG